MKNLFLFFSIILISIWSCNNVDETSVETSKEISLRFDAPSSNSKSNASSSVIFSGIIVKKDGKLSLVSDNLEILDVVNSATGKKTFFITEKLKNTENQRSGGPAGVRSGYQYDGSDCWVYGTWVTGDNGDSLFIASSPINQITHNVCGWSNLC